MDPVGHAQLREGPARPGRARGARDVTRPVPERPGGGPVVAALIGPDEARKVAEAALDLDAVDGVEVLFTHEWGGLSRFADSAIHQSTWREDTNLRVRVVSKGRVGVASTNEFTPEGAKRVAESAKEMAAVASPDPLFPGLAPKAPIPQRPDAFDEVTSTISPEDRAERIASLVSTCDPGFHAAG